MLLSLALLLMFGFLGKRLAETLALPGIVGMVAVGMLLGPHGVGWLAEALLAISADLRALALIVILLRAGLGLHRETLNAVGFASLKLGSIPCILEGIMVLLISRWLWELPWLEAGMLGFIIAAVSPAVVVPAMLKLREAGLGADKRIPTMILAGASLDDVFAITLFSAFLGMALGQGTAGIWAEALRLPLNILLGTLGGAAFGVLLLWLYNLRRFDVRNTEKLVLLLASSMIYYSLGNQLGWASLLGIMAAGLLLLEYRPRTAVQFARKLNRVWVFAEIMLFCLVGAAVNVHLAWQAGLAGLIVIVCGLAARSAGVWLATGGTKLTKRERWFCAVAYWPKATVQAAVGGIPLAMGVASGDLILAVAVLAIVVTAPLGAFGIEWASKRFLNETETGVESGDRHV